MIYFDNAATTFLSDRAAKTYAETATVQYANSESLHSFGFAASNLLENSRRVIAQKMGVKPDEVYFCGCGTLADNTALLGSVNPKRGGRIITTAFEHPAVLNTAKKLEENFEVIYLKPVNGHITPEMLADVLTEDTRLVSVMHVNNETGAVQDIRAMALLAHRVGALFHTDAVQGFMKEPFGYSCVDLASFSAHKTHGPKGLGALYVKKGVNVRPIYYGGEHEKGLFAGTVNVPGICAWAQALTEQDAEKDRKTVALLKERMLMRLAPLCPITVSPEDGSPYILNVVFPHYIAENIIHALSMREMYISSGSACSSRHPGAVFKALGLEQYAKNALRISFCTQNTAEEVDTFCDALGEILSKLIKK